MKRHLAIVAPVALVGGLLGLLDGLRGDPEAKSPAKGDKPHGIRERVPWTTSRITGTPEPPPPYRVERVFPKLVFKNPLLMARAPGMKRFFVGEQESKLYSFPMDQNVAKPDLFLDLTKEIKSWDPNKSGGVGAVYGLVFHPNFAKNRYCYICYVLNGKNPSVQLPDGSRVSRFKVTDTDPPRVDPASEKIIITFLAGGHNGGDLHFGPEGFLYISTGDGSGPNPPDGLDTGQDCTDLLSSILRIEVDKEDPGKAYAVPPDNPFVKTANVRPEIWSYGFRNPWRMSFDRATGDLWVGDVGWELWEMVFRIKKGGNYGWSAMEGRQQVKPEGKRGPTAILPPALDFPHTEAASITGGYVYRGKKLKDLVGAYICGDWVTRKIWATRFDGDNIVSHKEIALGTQRIVSFGEDHDGELYILNYEDNGTIQQLVPNEVAPSKTDFPRKLSDTGLFTSVKEHIPAPGVIPFSINAQQWADHATSERFVAVPEKTTIKMFDGNVPIPGGFFSGSVFFPKDGVLVRTIALETERGNPKSKRRLETQILHFDGAVWRGYTYQWNDEQTDALLVDAAGKDVALSIKDAQAPGGQRKQTWHIPSRTECLKCHNPWGGNGLAFTVAQLNKEHDYGGVVDNQLRAFKHVGLVEFLHRDEDFEQITPLPDWPQVRLTNPHDAKADLDARARSYLHVNCAHCHQFGAGGTADMQLPFNTALEQTKTLEVRPVQGTFGIPGANILAPGDPFHSILYYRMSKLGGGRMPHVGSEIVDEPGLRLIHDWIRKLPVRKDERALLERLRALDEPAALAGEKASWDREVRKAMRDLVRSRNPQIAQPDDKKAAESQVTGRQASAASKRAIERTTTINQILSSTSSAVMLAQALGENNFPHSLRSQVLSAAMASPDPQIRDLFERFVPDEQRVKRLGSVIKPEQILSLKGSADRGKELFFKSATLQCANCHKIGTTGTNVGPDLADVGKRLTRPQILESILEPSKNVDPKYVNYMLETAEGKIHTGLLAEKNGKEVVLRIAEGKEVRIPAGKVTALAPQRTSLMPELLLRDLTAQQAVDLLEFLASLR